MVATGDFDVSSDSPLYPMVVDEGTWRDPFAKATSMLFPERVRLADGRSSFLSDHLALRAEVTLPALRREGGVRAA